MTESIQFLDGLALSIIKEDIASDLERCYSDAGVIRHDIDHAIRDFQIGGVLGITSGALRIIKIIKEIKTVFTGCADAGLAIERFVQWAET